MIRHPLDPFSIVVGLLSLSGSVAWFLVDGGLVDASDLVWGAPVALVLVGVAVIALSVRPPARP